MKTLAILAAASLALVGCDSGDRIGEPAGAENQIEQQKEQIDQQQDRVEQSADQTKDQIEAQAEAQKEKIEAQKEAQQAQLEAKQESLEAQVKARQADATTQPGEPQLIDPAGAAAATAEGTDGDRMLSKQVKESLMSQNATFANSGVNVMAMDGKVTLRGTVSSEAQKEALEAQAKAVSGVKSVDNKLEVKSE